MSESLFPRAVVEHFALEGFTRGWNDALNAAREAAIRALTDDDGFVRQSELDDVLEYIDALREEKP